MAAGQRADVSAAAQFGREKELETIRNIIRHTSTSYSRQLATSRGSFVVSSNGSAGTPEDPSDSLSSKSEASGHMIMSPDSPGSKVSSIELPGAPGSGTVTSGSTIPTSDGLRRVALAPSQGRIRTQAVIIMGPAG